MIKCLQQGSYDWSESIQGIILGSYYYGYTLTNIFGGRFAERWGGKWVCCFGIMIPAILNALTPLASEYHVGLVIAIRIIIGGFQGLVYSALVSMYSHWIPKKERATATALLFFGGIISAVVTLPISAWLCKSTIFGGWPSTFYIFSLIHLIWFVLWCWLAHDTPELDPRISYEEKAYIHDNTDTIKHKVSFLIFTLVNVTVKVAFYLHYILLINALYLHTLKSS